MIAPTLAHLGGADAEDFTRSETRALFVAISAAAAAGARSAAEVLAALPPALRADAEWILAAGDAGPGAEVGVASERLLHRAREAVTALRLLNARREIEAVRGVLETEPGRADLAQRVADLAAVVRVGGRAYPRAETVSRAALQRERVVPRRAPLAALGVLSAPTAGRRGAR